ncbi:MAG: conserved phage C-terminal domain-containing protein [Eubacteriales bacterium]|nr:conserved phage C-terminal domain-containing protein [Eubacteriales bacterium]
MPEIVAHLNEKCGTQYRTSSSKTKKVITARLNEGYSPEDFQIVIDKMADEWLGTDMEKYLRPETLFGTKFESYLNRRQSRKRDVAGDYLRNVIQGNEGYESYRSG